MRKTSVNLEELSKAYKLNPYSVLQSMFGLKKRQLIVLVKRAIEEGFLTALDLRSRKTTGELGISRDQARRVDLALFAEKYKVLSNDELMGHFSISNSGLYINLNRAIQKGLLNEGDLKQGRKHRLSREQEDKICLEYDNNGCNKISKSNGVSATTVRDVLIRNNIRLRTERVYKKIEGNKRKGLRKSEFLDSTKKAAFEREKGICQECHLPISEGWRSAVYHHKELLRRDGESTLDNCMVLHSPCHWLPAQFKKLHGFELPQSYSSNSRPLEFI